MNPETAVIKTVIYRCGGKSLCKHKETVYHHCGKKGHILRACSKRAEARSETRSPPQTPRNTMPVTIEGEEEDVYTMFPLRSKKYDPIYITIIVNGAPLLMEVDTGATISVISKATYDRAWREEPPPLAPSTARLRTYTGEEIPVKGEIEVDVCHRDQQKRLTLIVTEGNGPSLLGRNWLTELRLNWKTTYQVRNSSALAAVLDDHKEIFRKELGTITCAKAEIHVDQQVPPSFHRPRPVPFALKQKVEAEGRSRTRATGERGNHPTTQILTVGGANRGSTQERWVGSTLRRLQSVTE